jgi:hypothetical protein
MEREVHRNLRRTKGITMATIPTDYQALVAKYTKSVNTDAVSAIVKYCGPALKTNDGKYVAASDKTETDRIVKGYCAKKLGLDSGTASAAVTAAALRMKADRMKHRVAFYYLVAENADKLSMLAGRPATKPKVKKTSAPKAAAAPRAEAPAAAIALAAPVTAAPASAAPVMSHAPRAANPDARWYMKGSHYDYLTS